jgi:hypothetical protein
MEILRRFSEGGASPRAGEGNTRGRGEPSCLTEMKFSHMGGGPDKLDFCGEGDQRPVLGQMAREEIAPDLLDWCFKNG